MANNDDTPLDDLSVFLAVVDAGGFRAAAKRLGLGASTVSETISRLEARVGTPLLSRSTRSVATTEAGQALADRVAPLIAETRAAVEAAADAGGALRGQLRLNVPGAVMVDILPPLVDRFLELHPGVSVEITVEDAFVDGIAAGCHAGIRYGESLARDVIAVPIGPPRQQYALAAAPDYLAGRTPLAHPRDIAGHDCIMIRFSSGALARWEFERDGETIELDPPQRLCIGVQAAAAAIGHAVAGRGLFMAFRNWLDPYIEDGRLVPLLRDWWPEFDGPRLYFPSRNMPPVLRAFIDLVAEDRRARRRGA